ncbi:MAG TPA: hemolysin III family protein [Gaiellaceae bacterium]|jgi:hemolysin III|nr:hemolysin III family protein [Gaiellaceae bacterium]
MAAALRPRLRGVLHAIAFGVSIVTGVLVVVAAPASRALPAAVFVVSATVMLGTSALYHRVVWSPRARLWMRRADHAGIYLLIAGTYTPVGLIALHGAWRVTILAVVWSGAGAAILLKLCWVRAPKWLAAFFGVGLGWAGVAAMPQLAANAGIAAVVLLAAGGLAYTLGALVYAFRRPDPVPAVFGYHEVFHALTIVALACQYVAVAFFVVDVT